MTNSPKIKASPSGSKFEALAAFDAEILGNHRNIDYLIGVDEVGRGCLAGPVVACALALPAKMDACLLAALAPLNDSKAISETRREELAGVLRANALWCIGQASVEEIDQINILQASLLAMSRALEGVLAAGRAGRALLLVDGNKPLKKCATGQMTVVKGDSRSASIAAASVVAKVERDLIMGKLSLDFPQYAWQANKGYPSKAHRQGILEHGACQWHRKSFRLLKEETEA